MSEPVNAPRKQGRRAYSITWLLALLALFSLLPAFIYSSVLINRHNQAQQETLRALQYAATRSLSEAVDREISGMLVTLRILSSSPSLQRRDFATFHQRTQIAMQGTGAFLIVVDQANQQLLNTRVEYGAPLPPTSDPSPIQEVLEDGQVDVSNFFMGTVSGALVFNVIAKVATEDGPLALLMTRNASDLGRALESSVTPEGWNAALTDTQNVVAASTDRKLRPGEIFPVEISASRRTITERRDLDGEPTDFVVHRSALTGWSVVTWAPVSLVTRPLVDSMLWLMGGAVLIGLLAALVIYLISRTIAKSVRTLAADARRLGAGELIDARDYAVSEFEEISTALSGAAHSRKEAEREINLLMREVAHRSKNQLSVIQSMAKQTAKSSHSLPEFIDDFQQRIIGLARSTDLLLNHGTTGISLQQLVEVQIQPFRPDGTGRVSISGPDVLLGAAAAQNLGMAVHEMATNAAKYGAFADTAGRVSVSWKWKGSKLEFVWREQGVTLPVSTARRGFGSTVIEQFVSAALDAKVTRKVHRDGIEWHLLMAEDQLSLQLGDEADRA